MLQFLACHPFGGFPDFLRHPMGCYIGPEAEGALLVAGGDGQGAIGVHQFGRDEPDAFLVENILRHGFGLQDFG